MGLMARASPSSFPRHLWLLLSAGAVLLASGLAARMNPEAVTLYLALGLILTVFVQIGWQVQRGLFDWLDTIQFVNFFFVIGIGWRAIDIVIFRHYNIFYYPYRPPHSVAYLNLALGLSWLSLGLFYAGFYSRLGAGLAARLPAVDPDQWDTRRVLWVGGLFSVLGLAFYYLYMRSCGGVFYYLTHLGRRAQISAGSHVWEVGVFFLPATSILWMVYYWGLAPPKRLWLGLVVGHALLSSAVMASLGARSRFMIIFVVAFGLRHYLVRPVKGRWMLCFAGLMFVLAISYVAYRRSASLKGFQAEAFQKRVQTLATNLYDFAIMTQQIDSIDLFAGLVAAVPDRLEPRYGSTYLVGWGLLVPQSLWPEKPRSPGIDVREAVGHRWQSHGIGATALGEAYWNFGPLGPPAVFWMLGVLARTLTAYRQLHRRNAAAVLLYLASLLPFLRALVRISATAVIGLMTLLLPLVFLMLYLSHWQIHWIAEAPASSARETAFPDKV